jgi:hypothetical protein
MKLSISVNVALTSILDIKKDIDIQFFRIKKNNKNKKDEKLDQQGGRIPKKRREKILE